MEGLSEGLGVAPFRSSAVAPPLRFRPAGEVRSAWVTQRGPFGEPSTRRGSAAQRAGKRYEKKIHTELQKLWAEYWRSPWFQYTNQSGTYYCQPDGLLHTPYGTVIIEVKYTFCSDAWWQLRKLYAPVVEAALKPKKLFLVLICRSYDPAVSFPEQPSFLPGLESFDWEGDCARIGVVKWRI